MVKAHCFRLGFGLISFLPLILACSDSGKFSTAIVNGKVTFQGNGVPTASVVFTPQAKDQSTLSGKAASGTTNAEGSFVLSTYKQGDGAVVGKHFVSVSSGDADKPLPGKTPPDLVLEVKPGVNELTIELVP
jgi:hypothetical protein